MKRKTDRRTFIKGSLTVGAAAGPGDLLKPQKVIAGRDPVAVDTLVAGILGRSPQEIVMFKKAADHRLGTTDLSRLVLKEVGA